MSKLETLTTDTWEDFVRAPFSVLVLGKSDCQACADWSAQLEEFLVADTAWSHVRFGKILLDKPGFINFKRANPWISGLEVLPFTQIYKNGERSKSFAGSGIERLTNRLESLSETAGS